MIKKFEIVYCDLVDFIFYEMNVKKYDEQQI